MPLAPSAKAALRFVETNGIVLESAHGSVPTFVDFVVGERVSRWWSHPKARTIFLLTRLIRDTPEVVTCRLVQGKVTYVHKKLWPALVKLSEAFPKNRLDAIREIHEKTGAHRLINIPFPEWVAADTLEKAKRMPKREAQNLLRKLLIDYK